MLSSFFIGKEIRIRSLSGVQFMPSVHCHQWRDV